MKLSTRSLGTLLLPVALLLAVVACSGDGGSFGDTGGNAGNPFAGSHTGAAPLDSGKTGSVSLQVQANNDVAGSLVVTTITQASRQSGFTFPPGTYPLSGSASSNGQMAASGTIPGKGSFLVSGNLPNGTLTITGGTTSYEGSFGPSGSVGLTFTQNNSNANLAPWPGTAPVAFEIDRADSDGSIEYHLKTVSRVDDRIRRLVVEIKPSMQVGQTYILNPETPLNEGTAEVYYTENEVGSGFPSPWNGATGTVTLVSRTETSMTVQLGDVRMHYMLGGGASNAFTVTGSISK